MAFEAAAKNTIDRAENNPAEKKYDRSIIEGSLPPGAVWKIAAPTMLTNAVAVLQGLSAIAGQNLGAREPERAREAVNIAAKFAFLGAAFLGIFYFFFPYQLLGIFGMNDSAALETGASLLRILSVSGILVSVALTFTGGLQGSGDTKSPLFISIISQIRIPLGICFILRHTIGLQARYIWLAILAGHFTRCLLSFLRFRQGKWQNIKVETDAAPA